MDETTKALVREAKREYYREWNKRNPGKRAEYAKKWRKRNPGKQQEYQTRYWLRKAEQMRQNKASEGKVNHNAREIPDSP